MAGCKSGINLLMALGVLAACVPSSAADSAAAPPISDEQYARMARELDGTLVRSFQLPAALKLDPELRTQAESMSAAHLARIRQQLPAWLREEGRQAAAGHGKRPEYTVFYAVWARVLNELALWQVEPGDAAYEKATLDALTTSSVPCDIKAEPYFSDFASRMLRVQAMPPAQRPAALAEERELLAHWGRPRAALPPWPDPLPQDAGMALVARMRAEGPRPQEALPPVLASVLLATRESYDQQPWETRCRFQQWWLRTSLNHGSTPAAALNAFRYGTMISAITRLGAALQVQPGPPTDPQTQAQAPANGVPAYPRLASWFDVTGTTLVRRRLDATGKPEQASVARRDIAVRGIRGVRPVAFEDTFDPLAVKYALSAKVDTKPVDAHTDEFQMTWSLDAETPAPQGGAK